MKIGAVDVTELHTAVSSVMRRVRCGEKLTVLDRGVPIATILPVDAGPLAELVASGRATLPTENIADILNKRESGPVSDWASKELQRLRQDRI
tara:strand:+ start:78 stop:356 length:279 start_codon:yes stop_codon:yes gene_type:complete